MHRIKEVIVVEGRYDKNTLRQAVDAVILETSGFGVFNDAEKRKLLKTLAEKRGLVVLTDSDAAGFLIRNHIRGLIDPKLVRHAYIPAIPGRERRKASPSKEGLLGVEGMRPEVLLDALRRAGATIDDSPAPEPRGKIVKADLYAAGLSGRERSAAKRRELLGRLGLPERLSASAMLDVLNALMEREEFYSLCAEASSMQTENSAPSSSSDSPVS